jgi:hypothetical protein
MTTRCKFKCDSVTHFAQGQFNVHMTPVIGGSKENEDFWKYTPAGSIEFHCLNEKVKFTPGKEYFLDIIEA